MAVGFPAKTNFTVGDVLTATQMNDITGTLNLLNPSAKGVVFAASAANTPAAVTVGANNTFLRAQSSAASGVEWAGAYTAFTPTWTNLTVGNATNTGSYLRIGKTVQVNYRLAFGTTSVMTGGPLRVTLPFTASVVQGNPWCGGAFIQDAGVSAYEGWAIVGGGDNAIIYVINSAGTYTVPANITSTVPMTWASTDELNIGLIYEAA
jgi:hypothetical protein